MIYGWMVVVPPNAEPRIEMLPVSPSEAEATMSRILGGEYADLQVLSQYRVLRRLDPSGLPQNGQIAGVKVYGTCIITGDEGPLTAEEVNAVVGLMTGPA